MNKIAIAIHGGACRKSAFLSAHRKESEEALAEAASQGYRVLKNRGSALDAVEAAVRILEDNPLFNAGRGSALNCQGQVEMDASIMNGKNLKAGAVSMVRRVKNPVSLARQIMNRTKHVLLSGYGALEFADLNGMELEPETWFITEHQHELFEKYRKGETILDILEKKSHGTVGAVALDSRGNLAAATSTGGTTNSLPGRIGDSCIIGAGCYANNETCAVSGTGEGECLIRGIIAHTISMMIESGMSLQEACDHVIHTRNGKQKGTMGVISVNTKGEIGISFNTQTMRRAWIGLDGELQIR